MLLSVQVHNCHHLFRKNRLWCAILFPFQDIENIIFMAPETSKLLFHQPGFRRAIENSNQGIATAELLTVLGIMQHSFLEINHSNPLDSKYINFPRYFRGN